MRRFVFPVPPSWQALATGRYRVDEATLAMTELGALPEDPVVWLKVQLREIAGDAPFSYERLSLDGLPALAGQETARGVTRLVMVIRIFDLGVLVQLDGPEGSFSRAREQVIDALAQGAVDWGGRELVTLADLFEGIPDRR